MNLPKEFTIAEETYGTTTRRLYQKLPESSIQMTEIESVRWKSFKNFFSSVFLPHGYPESVSKDYMQYQIWDSIQAFASSINGSIATHAILKGVGVGDETASSLAATMSWIMKDGASMIGRITFSWLKGTNLDSDCKMWRIFADVLNDISLFFDLASFHMKEFFLSIMCVSGILKAIVGVAGGATRAAFTQHQARKNNMADVSAKDGSQETLVNLVALVCSLAILPAVGHNYLLIWSLYILMTGIHLSANYFAVNSIVMETFNKNRFHIYMKHYIESHMKSYLSVDEVNKREKVGFVLPGIKAKIRVGISFEHAICPKNTEEVDDLIELYEKSNYFLSRGHNDDFGRPVINICLTKEATAETQLEAMYHACIISEMHSTESNKDIKNFLYDLYDEWCKKDSGIENINQMERFSKELTEKNFVEFKRTSEELGWVTNVVLFDSDLWYVKW